jgi:hypothetical protein
MAKGIRLRYTGPAPPLANGGRIHLVPLTWQPFPARNLVVGRDECPTCGIIHPCKTVHLHLEPDNTCLVSEGVLAHLNQAGLALSQLKVEGSTKTPPPLRIDGKALRPEIDSANRHITQWSGADNGG